MNLIFVWSLTNNSYFSFFVWENSLSIIEHAFAVIIQSRSLTAMTNIQEQQQKAIFFRHRIHNR